VANNVAPGAKGLNSVFYCLHRLCRWAQFGLPTMCCFFLDGFGGVAIDFAVHLDDVLDGVLGDFLVLGELFKDLDAKGSPEEDLGDLDLLECIDFAL
jgi:hypothetical protein